MRRVPPINKLRGGVAGHSWLPSWLISRVAWFSIAIVLFSLVCCSPLDLLGYYDNSSSQTPKDAPLTATRVPEYSLQSPFSTCISSAQCANASVEESVNASLPMRNIFDDHLHAIKNGDLTAAERASQDLILCLQQYKGTRILAAAAKITAVEGINECSGSEAKALLKEVDVAVTKRILTIATSEDALVSSVEWLMNKANVDDKIISEAVGELIVEGDSIILTYKPASKVSAYWKQAWELAESNRAVSVQLAKKADGLAPMFTSYDTN